MKSFSVEVLTIGDELMRGEQVDTNAAWLAGRVMELGVPLGRVVSVGDDLDPLVAVIREGALRASVLLVSGGLGPTDDDRTREAMALAAGRDLERNEEALAVIRQRFQRANYPFTPNNERQAFLPRTARLLPNSRGTAPGFVLSIGDCQLFCMPGVPVELKAMFDEEVAPLLGRRLDLSPAVVRTINIFGLGESQIDHRLADLAANEARDGCHLSVHFRTSFPENRVVLVARPEDPGRLEQAREQIERLDREVRLRIGRQVFGVDGTSFSDAVVRELREARATLSLAESCTGGLAGDLLTRAAGSSEVFELGLVTYANAFKRELLGVPRDLLEAHGAVSQECAEAMARGVRQLAGATLGLAISGIAGPGGGTADKPVGTVHLALASETWVRHLHRVFPFDRQRVKLLSAYAGLSMVLHQLRGHTGDPLEGRWAPNR